MARLQLSVGTFGVDDVGDGVPIVFLHGFPHARALWRHQLTALRERARCIAPDLRGFGESTAAGPYSMDRYADDVAALLDHLRIERAVVVGLSMGGYVALACWRRFPERMLGLALLDTHMAADDADSRARRDAMILQATREGPQAVAESMLPGMTGKSTRANRPHVIAEIADLMRSAPVDGIVGALAAMRDRPDSTGTVETITVPTWIVTGDEDVLTPPKRAEAMAAALPASTPQRLEVIAGAGHVSVLERPSAVNHVLGELLALVRAS